MEFLSPGFDSNYFSILIIIMGCNESKVAYITPTLTEHEKKLTRQRLHAAAQKYLEDLQESRETNAVDAVDVDMMRDVEEEKVSQNSFPTSSSTSTTTSTTTSSSSSTTTTTTTTAPLPPPTTTVTIVGNDPQTCRSTHSSCLSDNVTIVTCVGMWLSWTNGMKSYFNSLQSPQVSFDTAATWVLEHFNPYATNLFEKKPTEIATGKGHAYARKEALKCLVRRGAVAIAAFESEKRTTSVVGVGRNNDMFSQLCYEPWRMVSLDVQNSWPSTQQMFAYQLEGVQHTGNPNSSHQGFHCLPQTADLSHDYFVFYCRVDDKGQSVVVGVEEVEHVPHDSQTGTSVVLNNEAKMASVLSRLAFNENRFDVETNTVVDRNGDQVVKSFPVIYVDMDAIATLHENPNAMEAPILSELNTDDWGRIRPAHSSALVVFGNCACFGNGAGVCTYGQQIENTPHYVKKHLSPTQKEEALALAWRKRNARWRHPENNVMEFRVPVVDTTSNSFPTSTTTSTTTSSSSSTTTTTTTTAPLPPPTTTVTIVGNDPQTCRSTHSSCLSDNVTIVTCVGMWLSWTNGMKSYFNSLQSPQVSFDTAATWVLEHFNPYATNLFEKKPTEIATGKGHAYARKEALKCLVRRGAVAIAAFESEKRTTSVVGVGRNNDMFSQLCYEPWRMVSLDVQNSWPSTQQMFAYQLEGVQHTGNPNSSHQGFHCLPQTADLSHDYFVFYCRVDDKGQSVVVGVEEVEHVPHDSQTGTSVVLNNEAKMASVLSRLAFNENRFDVETNTVVDRNGDQVVKSFPVIYVDMDAIATLHENPNAMEAPILSELNTDDWGRIRPAHSSALVVFGNCACFGNGAGVCTYGQQIENTPHYVKKHLSPTQKEEALALAWRKRNARWRHPQNMNENNVMEFRVPVVDTSSSSSSSKH